MQLTEQFFHNSRNHVSYRNQYIDLICKSMDWFLYDRDLRHERGKDPIKHL